jgi:hypothetical protein
VVARPTRAAPDGVPRCTSTTTPLRAGATRPLNREPLPRSATASVTVCATLIVVDGPTGPPRIRACRRVFARGVTVQKAAPAGAAARRTSREVVLGRVAA